MRRYILLNDLRVAQGLVIRYYANRAGHIAGVQFPLIVALSSKNNMVQRKCYLYFGCPTTSNFRIQCLRALAMRRYTCGASCLLGREAHLSL